MTKVVYTPTSAPSLWSMVSPIAIVRNLYGHRRLIMTMANRDFQAIHRGTIFGVLWTVLSPMLMLGLFTVVFGYIFKGRFTPDPAAVESPLDYAVALYVGMTCFNCISLTMGAAPGILPSNQQYVKALAFPLEVLPTANVLTLLFNFVINLCLCVVAFFAVNGFVHPSAIILVVHAASLILMALGVCWLLSSTSVFIRDIPAVIPPLNLVLMFASAVFFPIDSVPNAIRWAVHGNPLALLIDQARGCLLYGIWPNPRDLIAVFIFSLVLAILGHWVFMRTKSAFADVM